MCADTSLLPCPSRCYAVSLPFWLAAPARRARASSQQITGMPLRFATVFSAVSAESLSPLPVVFIPSVRFSDTAAPWRGRTQCKEATWPGIGTVPPLTVPSSSTLHAWVVFYTPVSVCSSSTRQCIHPYGQHLQTSCISQVLKRDARRQEPRALSRSR
jgi:hypothetical protein